MNNRKKFLWICVCILFFIGFIAASAPFFFSWFPNIHATTKHFAYIDLNHIKTDELHRLEWQGNEVFVIKPRAEVLEQINKIEEIPKWGEQPPDAQTRLDEKVKVFMLTKHNGVLFLSEVHYWQTVIPCSKFEYLPNGYETKKYSLSGVLKCNESKWESWKKFLVFDLNGRSQTPEVANLFVPKYVIKGNQIILGAEK